MQANLLEQRIPVSKIVDFCHRQPIKQMWAFGSVLGEWRSDSDVDLLVEFFPGQEPDLLGRLDLQDELEDFVGHKLDLVPQNAIDNPFRRESIWQNRIEIYAAL